MQVITSMSLCDVQAYVAPAETRPAAHTLWLDAVDDELLPAASGAQKLRYAFHLIEYEYLAHSLLAQPAFSTSHTAYWLSLR